MAFVAIIRWINTLIIISEVLFVFALIIFGGFFFSTPEFEPRPADLIVVLGGGGGDRINKGLDLFNAGYSNDMLITGLPEMNNDVMPTYSKWRLQYLIEQGVPKRSIILDDSAKNTYEEAVNIKRLMINNKWQRVLIVSDPPHLRRLSIIFSFVFGDKSDLSFFLISSSPEWWSAQYWWKNTISAQFVLLEIFKLIYLYFNKL
ncbi:MAG: YdcF family protein [Gammaproteobacteria bacterium]|nr:YdcF family protein [Gammaproteobacteria bacterium]